MISVVSLKPRIDQLVSVLHQLILQHQRESKSSLFILLSNNEVLQFEMIPLSHKKI